MQSPMSQPGENVDRFCSPACGSCSVVIVSIGKLWYFDEEVLEAEAGYEGLPVGRPPSSVHYIRQSGHSSVIFCRARVIGSSSVVEIVRINNDVSGPSKKVQMKIRVDIFVRLSMSIT